uniref:Uncharacterized protein n=1 Tax=Strigamia maritima TaxID=126957 RepID=T1J8A9_STRMM
MQIKYLLHILRNCIDIIDHNGSYTNKHRRSPRINRILNKSFPIKNLLAIRRTTRHTRYSPPNIKRHHIEPVKRRQNRKMPRKSKQRALPMRNRLSGHIEQITHHSHVMHHMTKTQTQQIKSRHSPEFLLHSVNENRREETENAEEKQTECDVSGDGRLRLVISELHVTIDRTFAEFIVQLTDKSRTDIGRQVEDTCRFVVQVDHVVLAGSVDYFTPTCVVGRDRVLELRPGGVVAQRGDAHEFTHGFFS